MSKVRVCRRLSGFLQAAFFAVELAFLAAVPHGAMAQGDRGGMPGDFDYYVLALSWSPTYCAGQDRGGGGYRGRGYDDRQGYGKRGSGEQCSGTRPYAFILHGLWPQYNRTGWPEFCRIGSRPWVPGETIDQMMDIMPSRRLVIREYKKHGVCSGLDPQTYFDTARRAYRGIHIPGQFQSPAEPLKLKPGDTRKAFLEANPQLSPESVQVVCSRDLLREVRICLTKDLAPRPCSRGEQNQRSCTYGTVTVPPVRGGGR
jgi:ribonuclease T2